MWVVPADFFDDPNPVCKNVRVEHPDGTVTELGDVHFEDMDAAVKAAVQNWKPTVQ